MKVKARMITPIINNELSITLFFLQPLAISLGNSNAPKIAPIPAGTNK